jgi:hypothetical protein
MKKGSLEQGSVLTEAEMKTFHSEIRATGVYSMAQCGYVPVEWHTAQVATD